jgi:hypothetical protein
MRKYIPQATYENFVYPNNNVAIYDNNDVVQDINSNEITGSTSGFTASISGTTLSVSFNYTWNKNGGEVFINQADRLHLFSVHMMTPAKKYFNPWRLIDYKYVTGTTLNSYTGSYTASVTAAEYGETLGYGEYSFEIRFIGGLNTFIVCQNYTISAPPSSPTPTPSPTTTPGLSPTPTPSPGTSPTPTPSPSSGIIVGYGLTRCDTLEATFFTTDPISSGQTYYSGAGYCYISTGAIYSTSGLSQIYGTVQLCSCN